MSINVLSLMRYKSLERHRLLTNVMVVRKQFLFILSSLGCHKVISNAVLVVGVQVKVGHRRVGHINLLLKLCERASRQG